MAYRSKRSKTSSTRNSSRGGTRYNSRGSSARTSRSKGSNRARSSPQTIRIVVEQPQATSSVGVVPANQNSARKAMF